MGIRWRRWNQNARSTLFQLWLCLGLRETGLGRRSEGLLLLTILERRVCLRLGLPVCITVVEPEDLMARRRWLLLLLLLRRGGGDTAPPP